MHDEARRLQKHHIHVPARAVRMPDSVSVSDDQVAVFNSGETSALPAQALGTRVQQQTYNYDWKDNAFQSGDDATAFFDRSLGTVFVPALRPSTRSPQPATRMECSRRTMTLRGNLVNLVVQRDGTCRSGRMPGRRSRKCAQRFVYDLDEDRAADSAMRADGIEDDNPYPRSPSISAGTGGHSGDRSIVHIPPKTRGS